MRASIFAVFGVAASPVMAVSACTSGQPSSSTAAESATAASPPGMSCAWPVELSAATDNTAFPDSAAVYWGQPIVASAGTRIVLSGRFPDARYVSLDVYTPAGVGSSLPDYKIAPLPGSVNPWQHQTAPGGRFTVTISPDPAPGQANTLAMPSGTTSQRTGYLVYRVYLPAGGDSADVPVPALTVEQGHAARTLPACRTHDAKVHFPAGSGSASGAGGSRAAPPQLQFYKPNQSTFNDQGLGNVDTAYLIAYLVRPPAGSGRGHRESPDRRARQPSLALAGPRGRRPLRSMCVGVLIRTTPIVANPLPGGSTDYGCRADEATRLNAAGDYTYVIGSESQRAAIGRVPGVTFLPFSTAHPAGLYLLGLRDILVSSSFAHSPRAVTQASDPAAAAAAMGAYYPRATVCPLATLTAHGPQGCER